MKRGGGKHNQIIADYPFDSSLEGKTLAEICEEFGSDPADTVIKMIIDGKCVGNWISRALNETDVENFMQCPSTMMSSDGSSLSLDGPLSVGRPHPRNFGAFPRVIEKYVIEKQILTLEEAIRKMTSFPAQKFSLYNRGSLEVGKWADIVVLDVEKLESPSLDNPKKYPKGIPYVLVNGELVIEKGDYTGELPGRIGRTT